ncbi:LysR family transcriptional regulator [Piscinibacter sp.]|uniref:LysR family transcriptional regulator n=1 Tax=Piscinibacter sp. TaxID=1903157 RepID=UPI002BA1BC0E|nr:LysR family transcriptional regulator [Albitalea sp.]HUG21702.1 LysR family transcriptional regulator [Albitalea sp.]
MREQQMNDRHVHSSEKADKWKISGNGELPIVSQALDDLNLLRTFVAVAQFGSFTAAAERLSMARPQVSLQIRRMETALGASLFNRTTRRVALTDAGQRLFDECAPLLCGMQEALEKAGSRSDKLRGRLRIAAPVEHAAQVLSPVVSAFANRHPDVRVELIVSDKVQDLVAEGIDVAIRVGWMRESTSKMTKLADFAQGVLASPTYLARYGRPKTPKDLAHHRWIALTLLPSPLTWAFTKGAKTVTVRMNAHLRTDSAVALRSLLVNGAGLSVGSLLHVANEVHSGSLVRLLPEWSLPSGVVHAVFPPGAKVAPAAGAFVQMVRTLDST